MHNYYVMHVPFLSTNGYMGISPVAVLQDAHDYGKDIQRFSANQLKDGVSAKIVLNAPAALGKSQKEEMINSFMETYRETAGNILLLESGVTASTMNLSPVDSKILEVEKITRSKVAMVYNIPPHLLGDYSDSAFRSQEHMMLQFLMLTMLPIVTAYEQEFNRKLLTREQRKSGHQFKFNMDAILRADAATQADVNFKAVRSAWATPDEIRSMYNKPPLPGRLGKHAMVSRDLATLENVVKGMAEPADPPADTPPAADGDEYDEENE
jgi:HK97 family phage portal protein